MTKEEFCAKFKVGDKIHISSWDCGVSRKILHIGETHVFFASYLNNELRFESSESIDKFQDFELYQEPKKMVKKYLWATKKLGSNKYRISDHFYKEEDAKQVFALFDLEFIKTNTFIEVEE